MVDNVKSGELFDQPLRAGTFDGGVLIDAPNGVTLTLTAQAAERSAAALMEAAQAALASSSHVIETDRWRGPNPVRRACQAIALLCANPPWRRTPMLQTLVAFHIFPLVAVVLIGMCLVLILVATPLFGASISMPWIALLATITAWPVARRVASNLMLECEKRPPRHGQKLLVVK